MATKIYSFADGTATTIVSGEDNINLDDGMKLLCRAIDAKIKNDSGGGASSTISSDNVYIPTAAFDSIMASFTI